MTLLFVIKGCVAQCPGCGAKCQYHSDHKGHHKADKHLLKCFQAWRYENNNQICEKFCWDDSYYFPVIRGQTKYPNFKNYLESTQPNWLNDVAAVHNEFGQKDSSKTDAFLDYTNKVKRCWMNTREPLIEYHKRYSTRELYDKSDYDKTWTDLEDSKKLRKGHADNWKMFQK
jgi:hypothetical protein